MKYFVDSNSTVWAFESDGSQDYLISDDMRSMSSSEIEAHCNPVLEDNSKLVEEQWRGPEMAFAQQQVTAIEYGDDLIAGPLEQWKAYWLELRAWKAGAPGFPDANQRPTRPA